MGRRLAASILLLTAPLFLLMGCGMDSTPDLSPTSTSQPTLPLDEDESAETPEVSDSYAEDRREMVLQGVIGYGIEDDNVIAAMGTVPRHLFVLDEYLDKAYFNHPLPIGYGQTISQPYIVALMSQELQVEEGDRVLEIGTGSGYQATILAEMGIEVYSIEIIGPLAKAADLRIAELGYTNVHVRHADGYFGWEEEAPFDAIIVTAAPDHVPQPLLDQLKIGGVLVIPVGPVGGYQELWQITREDDESYQATSLGGVRFVPLTRQVREE